jgi:hypothetical protein
MSPRRATTFDAVLTQAIEDRIAALVALRKAQSVWNAAPSPRAKCDTARTLETAKTRDAKADRALRDALDLEARGRA